MYTVFLRESVNFGTFQPETAVVGVKEMEKRAEVSL